MKRLGFQLALPLSRDDTMSVVCFSARMISAESLVRKFRNIVQGYRGEVTAELNV
jgi:hypothetical protein